MKLKSFGCSFTWGSELPGESFIPPTPSLFAWPALVAADLGYDYECHAFPGAGNMFIADQILNQCTLKDNDYFIINWSFIDRFDYIDIESNELTHFPVTFVETGSQPWKTCRPGDNSPYYKLYHSEYRDKLASLQLIKVCVDVLLQKKIPFIMTCLDGLIFDQRWHTSPGMLMLQEEIKKYITTFDGKNFIDYLVDLGYKKTKHGHFDKHAHATLARYVINFLRTQNTDGC